MTVWERLGVEIPTMVRAFGGLPEWEIDKGRTALMIVDMQHYCACPGEGIWALAHEKGMAAELDYLYERIEVVTRNLERLLIAAREQQVEVIHINGDMQVGDRMRARAERAGRAMPDSGLHKELRQRSFPNDAEVIAPLRPLPNEIVIKKHGAGPFGLTGVDRVLRSLDIEFLIIGGAVTHQCVEMTIRGASDFGYKAIMVEDGTATLSEELQRNAMIALGDWFCKIRTTDEILSEILVPDRSRSVLGRAVPDAAVAAAG